MKNITLTRLKGLPTYSVGRVTLLAGPTFLHIDSQVNLVRARQSDHARVLLVLAMGLTFLSLEL